MKFRQGRGGNVAKPVGGWSLIRGWITESLEKMESEFQSIAVVGPGVLGGSLALKLSQIGVADLRLWGRRDEVLEEARAMGVKGLLTTDLPAAVENADLVVFAVPVGVMLVLAGEIALMPAGSRPRLVTDVGSIKGMLAERLPRIFGEGGPSFVGAHPMCGSERTGMQAADPEMFASAACFVCGDEWNTSAKSVVGFWKAVGCRVFTIDAGVHDEVVAKVSHLPHVAAAATVLAALGNESSIGRYCGNGLRDTTRVAAGSPKMWTEILLENRQAVVAELKAVRGRLEAFEQALETGDAEVLARLLADAKTLRDGLAKVQ